MEFVFGYWRYEPGSVNLHGSCCHSCKSDLECYHSARLFAFDEKLEGSELDNSSISVRLH